MLVSGTSTSAPTFTGFVSLLNDARLKAGLPPLGFLNPFLYSKGLAGLNDITIGHNTGCGTKGFNVSNIDLGSNLTNADIICRIS